MEVSFARRLESADALSSWHVLKALLKRLAFGEGPRPHRVLFGPGRGLKVILDPQVQTQRILGLAEYEISGVMEEFARQCGTFCDVGASDGWYSLLTRKVNPKARIVAIEPDPSLGELAKSNFALNGVSDNLVWIQGLCGTQDVRLDDVLKDAPEPIFLKIDIEGAELDALESGAAVLSSRDCRLVVETHQSDLETQCTQLLQGWGYDVSLVKKGAGRNVIPEQRPLPHNQWLSATRVRTKPGQKTNASFTGSQAPHGGRVT